MNDKQLELLIDAADHEWIAAKYRVEMGVDRAMHGDECEEKALELIRAARADVAAMRQTITAEALAKESAWRETDGSLYGKTWKWAWYDGYGMLDLKIKTSEDGRLLGVYGCHDRILSATTMYDLRELVRLLGGASQ